MDNYNTTKTRIFICSPFSADNPAQQLHNIQVARAVCLYATRLGHAPYAPHLLYPQFLDDNIGVDRENGINCGLSFMRVCREVWVVADPRKKGALSDQITEGMLRELEFASSLGIPIECVTPEFQVRHFNPDTIVKAGYRLRPRKPQIIGCAQ